MLPMKLLIVDDNDIMRQMIKGIVAQPADQVQECSDGRSVVSTYEAFRPDWVLMDINMNTLNGLQATRMLKAVYPEARVAIVTNYGDQEFRDEAKAAGAEKYFLKDNLPAIRDQLLNPQSPIRDWQS